MTATGRATVFDSGIRVYGPREVRKDGEWSKKHHVVAIFLRPVDAERYLKERLAEGYPAFVSSEDDKKIG